MHTLTHFSSLEGALNPALSEEEEEVVVMVVVVVVCVCMHRYIHGRGVWEPEVILGCLPQSLSTLCFETESLSWSSLIG